MRSTTVVLLSAFVAAGALAQGDAAAASSSASTTSTAADANRAADANHPGAANVKLAPPERLDPSVFRCGPILVADHATRTRIEQLYREQFDLRQSTQAQLRDLTTRMQTETDFNVREELSRQGGRLKEETALRDMELGLEIARLNGDAPRAAEYESAIDHVRHPEKYMPALRSPQEVEALRARERASAR